MARILVVGAGVAGLAAAAAMGRRGAEVTVVERAPSIRAEGAGIQVSPNGWAVLRALGLGDLEDSAIRSRAVVLADGPSGREVARLPLGEAPFWLMHRADLIEALAVAARNAGAEILTAEGVDSVSGGSRPQVILETGGEAEADLVIGADGARSSVRTALNGRVTGRFSGQVAWRAVIDGQAAPEARVEMGARRHLVSYPLSGGRVNLVGVEERAEWAAEGWRRPGDPDQFRAAFAGFAGGARRLERVSHCHLWGLFEHPVADRWTGGGLAIIGDAAHPTLPFLAQGANLALEDAWTLSEAHAAGDLAAWQSARIPRVRRAIEAARGNAANYHLSGARRAVAHAGLRAVSRAAPGMLTRRFDWLYGHDVTA